MRWFEDPHRFEGLEFDGLKAARRRLDYFVKHRARCPDSGPWLPPDIRDDIATLADFVDKEMDY